MLAAEGGGPGVRGAQAAGLHRAKAGVGLALQCHLSIFGGFGNNN